MNIARRFLPLMCVALGVSAASGEDAPQMRITDPTTGQSTIQSMVEVSTLPKAQAQRLSRLSDSTCEALRSAIAVADTTRMDRQVPKGLVRGGSLKGAAVGSDGKVAISVEAAASQTDLTPTVAWAIWYVRTYGDNKIQFSLDPKNANNFAEGNNARYVPEEALKPFAIGHDLYEADMDLKYYALGYERAGGDKVRDIVSPLPGYRSRLQITADLFAKGIERESKVMARLWIVCDSVFVTSSEKAMRIDSVRVKIHARQMGIANGKELEDIADADTVTALFTHWFQSNYFVLAQRHPELAAVVENSKALAIARWIAAHKLEPQEEWANMLLPTVETSVVSGPALVRRDTLVRPRPNGKDILTVQLAGGVEVSGALVENRLAASGSSTKAKEQTSSSALSAKLEASLASGKNALRPLKDDWLKSVRTRKSAGHDWTMGADGLPSASVDAKGRTFRYAGNGKSIGAATARTDHAQATLQRTETGYSLEYQDQEHYLSARYDAKGARTALWEFPRRVQVPAGR